MTLDAEQRNYALWELDPYGTGSMLSSKREKRGWQRAQLEQVTDDVDDTVACLLRWTGGLTGTEIFPSNLPWNQSNAV